MLVVRGTGLVYHIDGVVGLQAGSCIDGRSIGRAPKIDLAWIGVASFADLVDREIRRIEQGDDRVRGGTNGCYVLGIHGNAEAGAMISALQIRGRFVSVRIRDLIGRNRFVGNEMDCNPLSLVGIDTQTDVLSDAGIQDVGGTLTIRGVGRHRGVVFQRRHGGVGRTNTPEFRCCRWHRIDVPCGTGKMRHQDRPISTNQPRHARVRSGAVTHHLPLGQGDGIRCRTDLDLGSCISIGTQQIVVLRVPVMGDNKPVSSKHPWHWQIGAVDPTA